MSIAQILEEAKTLPTSELESLEHSLRLELLQRTGHAVPAEERRLLGIINHPMSHTERFIALTEKWQDEGLADDERAELLAIVSEREEQNVERVEAVAHLSELQAVPFKALWKQLMGEAPALIVPKN